MSKKRVAALGASAASAALVGSALFAPVAFAADGNAEPTPSAYAIGASGLVNIAKTPHATGTEDPAPVVSIPGEPLVTAKVLDSKSAPGSASSKVTGLTVGQLPNSPIPGIPKGTDHFIEVDLLEASCTQGDVSSNIAQIRIAGRQIPVDVSKNTAVVPKPLQGVVEVNLNEQTDNPDGSTTVNAVSITILDAADEQLANVPIAGKLAGQTITLASATCAPTDDGDQTPPDDGENPTPPDDGDDNNNGGNDGDGNNGDADQPNDNGTAPTPEPQPGHISVTG